MTLGRSPAALGNRSRRADTNRTCITDGASGTAAPTARSSTTLVHTKIAASAVPPQQFFWRDVAIIRRLIANGAVLAVSFVYLSLFVLVSAIAFIYKSLILATTYVVVRLYPAEFDRDAVIRALSEIEKDSPLR